MKEFPQCVYGPEHAGDYAAVRGERGNTVAGLCRAHFLERWRHERHVGLHIRTWEELAAREGQKDGQKRQTTRQSVDSPHTARREPQLDRDDSATHLPGVGDSTRKPSPPLSEGESDGITAGEPAGDDRQLIQRYRAPSSEARVETTPFPKGTRDVARIADPPQDLSNLSYPLVTWWQGAGTLQLTTQEGEILTAPVEPGEVCVNYQGQVYMPWHWYVQRLNSAVGVGQWSLVPLAKVNSDGYRYHAYYALIIRGVFVAESYGEAVLDPKNRAMTPVDAMKGARSNSLAGCCKTLGVALELWNPRWVDNWKRKYQQGNKPGKAHESEYSKTPDFSDDAREHLDSIQREGK